MHNFLVFDAFETHLICDIWCDLVWFGQDNVLRIGEDAVPFLSEGELDQYTKKFTEGNGDEEMAEAGAPGNGEDYPQEVVERFTNMGFSKEQAVAALRSSGGDAELAASLLLSGFD